MADAMLPPPKACRGADPVGSPQIRQQKIAP